MSDATSKSWRRWFQFRLTETNQKFHPRQYSLFTLLVAISILASIMAILNWSMSDPKPSPTRQCRLNLKQIALALHNYHSVCGSFPPAYIADSNGRPMHSWRVLILAALGHDDLYRAYHFDEPWDGPNNRKLINRMPDVYRCPRDTGAMNATSYLAIAGTDTLLAGPSARRMGEVKDGLSNTVAIVEVGRSSIPWTQPVDWSVEQFVAPQTVCHHTGGRYLVLANGAIEFQSDQAKEQDLRDEVTIAGGERTTATSSGPSATQSSSPGN